MSKNPRAEEYEEDLISVIKIIKQNRIRNQDARISWLQEVQKAINTEMNEAINPEQFYQTDEGL